MLRDPNMNLKEEDYEVNEDTMFQLRCKEEEEIMKSLSPEKRIERQ